MTYSQLVDYMDIIQDKYGSPYFTTSEKERLLIQAELDVIKSYFPEDGEGVNVELNQNTIMALEPIIFTYSGNMNGSGQISKATVNSSLTSSFGFSTKILRLLAISYNDYPVRTTRLNNWFVYLKNTFKVPVSTAPRYYETASNYIFSPVSTSATIALYGIRYPRTISSSGSITSELPDILHNDIVSRALEIAGVGSRDQMLSELKQLNKV